MAIIDKNKKFKSAYGRYSHPKNNITRRQLAIVNPINFLYTSDLIAREWPTIRKSLAGSNSSSSPIAFSRLSERALVKERYTAFSDRMLQILAQSDRAIRTDISQFYGSIYTHSITWALHGKETAKALWRSGKLKGDLGQQLDDLVRYAQDEQSVGLPIGPDTSRILSEMIGVALDQEITKEHPARHYVRFVDDVFLGFEWETPTLRPLSTAIKAFSQYELHLNEEKTEVVDSYGAEPEDFIAELLAFQLPTSAAEQKRSLDYYFGRVGWAAKSKPRKNYPSLAVIYLDNFDIRVSNRNNYIAYLLRTARSYPHAIENTVISLINRRGDGWRLPLQTIGEFCNAMIVYHCALRNSSEVAWCLYLCLILKFRLSDAAGKAVSSLLDSVCALIALDLEHQGLTDSKLDKTLWRTVLNSNGFQSEHWLLAYEAPLKGWLKPPNWGYLKGKNMAAATLFGRGISFYDSGRPVLTASQRKARNLESAIDRNRQIAELLQAYFW
ncbi:MAG: RNA-directed DNA polymerase [Hyphomonas sp.]